MCGNTLNNTIWHKSGYQDGYPRRHLPVQYVIINSLIAVVVLLVIDDPGDRACVECDAHPIV
jgi:hypothetical protein